MKVRFDVLWYCHWLINWWICISSITVYNTFRSLRWPQKDLQNMFSAGDSYNKKCNFLSFSRSSKTSKCISEAYFLTCFEARRLLLKLIWLQKGIFYVLEMFIEWSTCLSFWTSVSRTIAAGTVCKHFRCASW